MSPKMVETLKRQGEQLQDDISNQKIAYLSLLLPSAEHLFLSFIFQWRLAE
jgi:hypothetical protein